MSPLVYKYCHNRLIHVEVTSSQSWSSVLGRSVGLYLLDYVNKRSCICHDHLDLCDLGPVKSQVHNLKP